LIVLVMIYIDLPSHNKVDQQMQWKVFTSRLHGICTTLALASFRLLHLENIHLVKNVDAV